MYCVAAQSSNAMQKPPAINMQDPMLSKKTANPYLPSRRPPVGLDVACTGVPIDRLSA